MKPKNVLVAAAAAVAEVIVVAAAVAEDAVIIVAAAAEVAVDIATVTVIATAIVVTADVIAGSEDPPQDFSTIPTMIAKDQVVSIHYTLTNDGGEKLDSSEGQDPLNYLHGHGNIVPGLENALAGKAEGDKFDVVVPPAEGYGERDEAQVGKLPRSQVGIEDVKAGMRLQADTPQGPMSLLVTEVTEEELTVDANHPLAGETLHFAIEVMKIRPAEAAEIDHGHVH